MGNHRLIVMSNDALVYEDLEILREMPTFKQFYPHMAMVRGMRTIYPSVTYPVHCSIASGCYPDKTGVITNEKVVPGQRKTPWYWFHDVCRCEDLFDAAHRAGRKTAAVFWPCTGNHPSIDYLIDEFWPGKAAATAEEAFRKSGTSQELYDTVVRRYLPGVTIRRHPETDQFIVDCACDIIRTYQPDLLMLHPGNVDSARHHSGVFSREVTGAVRHIDGWLLQLISACRNAGTLDDTVFALISDHGQMDVVRSVNLNVLFAKSGLIEVNEQGEVADWKAWSHSSGLSAQIYLRDPADAETRARVQKLLDQAVEDGIYGIGSYMTEEEAEEKEHLAGPFSFIAESDGYTSFADAWTGPVCGSSDSSDYRTGHAIHGHLPDRGPQPPLFLFGPGIREKAVLDRRPIVDEAPTFACILGISLPHADGTCMDELLCP